MKLRFIIYTLIAVTVLTTAGSCGGGDTVSQADTIPYIDSVAKRLQDSLDSIAALPPDVLRDSIRTVEDVDSFMRQSGHWPEYSAGVIDTIARQDLAYAEKLLRSTTPYFIVADKQRMMVVLYDKYGRPRGAYKMACSAKFGAKHAWRDNRTPEGYFTAEGVHNSVEWLFTDDDGHTSEKRGQFGPRFIRLKESPMIGIHGTCAPWSRGHRSSHGCMRLHNAHILELVEYASAGMPVIISPSDRDQQVNREEGYRHITQLHLPLVAESPINEEIPGLREYEDREKLIQHRKDSIAAVQRERLRLRHESDSLRQLADSLAMQNLADVD